MRKLVLPILLSLAIGFSSCSEKIDVAAPYKDVTVVYSIMNMNDTAYYIRIQKAFMDETKSAVNMATEVDSNYYADLDVTMVEWDTVKQKITNTFNLDKVDMGAQGYPKESGAFVNSPNIAYKLRKPNPAFKVSQFLAYRLIINNKKTNRIDSSENFRFVSADSSMGFGGFYIPIFQNAYMPLYFPRTTSAGFQYSLTGRIPLNARMIEGHMIFNYIDSNAATGTSERKSIDYLFASDVGEPTTTFELRVENSAIYRYLSDEIGPAPVNVTRYIDSCDLYIYAGSDELYNYQQITLSQTGGLTGEQIKPFYTNMKGANAIGLIGTRAVNRYRNAGLDAITMDSMMKNELLKPLAIRGRTSN